MPKSGTAPAWSEGYPTEDGSYWCEIQFDRTTKMQPARWYEDAWHFYNMDVTFAAPVLRWHKLPEEG